MNLANREDIGQSCAEIAIEAKEDECRESCDMIPDSGLAECQTCIEDQMSSNYNASQCLNLSGSTCFRKALFNFFDSISLSVVFFKKFDFGWVL